MSEERDLLLMEVLRHVPAMGWTPDALRRAEAETGLSFPGGVAEAVDAFADWADRRMEQGLDLTALGEMRVRDRITLLVRRRLEALHPHREAVRREAAYLASRPGVGSALLWRISHRMWRLAGDTATDFNHYTKRALLSGVIVSTTMCWLGDKSEGFADTWTFLDRRIENVMGVGKAIGQAKKLDPSDLLGRVVEFAGRVRHKS
jgi:ubiquinone biosynthesis protein COQ9